MSDQTLANVFDDPGLEASIKQLFSREDMEKTASLASAQDVDNASDLVGALVARATDQLLDVSLDGIMTSAWIKILAIQEFASGEKLRSDETHAFVLSEHKITSRHSPRIELLVYDNQVAEITVDILLTLLLARTTLMIRRGRIMEVQVSGCQAMGVLSCLGRTILEKQTTELDFHTPIKLGKGIEIPAPLRRAQNGDSLDGNG